jgi:hypothetical protein
MHRKGGAKKGILPLPSRIFARNPSFVLLGVLVPWW